MTINSINVDLFISLISKSTVLIFPLLQLGGIATIPWGPQDATGCGTQYCGLVEKLLKND